MFSLFILKHSDLLHVVICCFFKIYYLLAVHLEFYLSQTEVRPEMHNTKTRFQYGYFEISKKKKNIFFKNGFEKSHA